MKGGCHVTAEGEGRLRGPQRPELVGGGGGNQIRFLTVTTDGTGPTKRQVSVDRTTIDVRGQLVDHICADAFRFDNDLIVEGWICHVDHLT